MTTLNEDVRSRTATGSYRREHAQSALWHRILGAEHDAIAAECEITRIPSAGCTVDELRRALLDYYHGALTADTGGS